MKKILLVIAMLVIAMPALATVSVTATDKGNGVVEVRYNCSAAEKVRSFALDISVDSSTTITNIRDFNSGESKKAGGGYGIFPGKFAAFINPASPNWADTNYTPVAPATDSNARSGLGSGAITVELGTLYTDTNAPGTSGLLFRLDIANNGASDCNLRIVQNNTRVGAVLEDTSVIQPVLTGTKVTFAQQTYTISGRVVGANAPMDTKGIEGVAMKGLPGDPNTDASGNFTATVSAGWSGTCTPTDPNNQWTWAPATLTYSGVSGNMASQNVTGTATECLNAKDPGYAAWVSVTWNKPACWCNRRQCRGDVGGTKSGFWVYSSDLNTFKSAYGRNDATLATVPNGICADLDHVKSGFRAYSNDLAIIKAYYGRADALVPECNLAPVITKVNKWNN